jgi:hypothetical protein
MNTKLEARNLSLLQRTQFSFYFCFSCNCYHHIIISVLIMSIMNAITPQSEVVSPLETRSHGYDDEESDAKQFPRTKTGSAVG